MSSTLDTRELAPDQVEQVKEMVERLDMGAMDRLGAAGMAGGPDRFQFSLVITKGGERTEITLPETAVPDDLKPLVAKMTDLARNA